MMGKSLISHLQELTQSTKSPTAERVCTIIGTPINRACFWTQVGVATKVEGTDTIHGQLRFSHRRVSDKATRLERERNVIVGQRLCRFVCQVRQFAVGPEAVVDSVENIRLLAADQQGDILVFGMTSIRGCGISRCVTCVCLH